MSNCDICKEIISVDNHHIESTVFGGKNVDWNRCQICPNCHRKVHTGKIIIEGWFASTATTGHSLIWRNKGEQSISSITPDPKVWLYGQSENQLENKW